ncbi:MAG: DUF3299 domain-containing protein [Burkholderiales bacterium]
MDVRKHVVAMTMAIGAMAIACGLGLGDAAAQATAAGAARTAKWDDLLPKDWDPLKQFRDKSGVVREGSMREMEMMEELRKAWDNAPTRPELNGSRLRLPGYVVPLDSSAGGLKEFLLVPYFGACIHSPPPPANQIVYVKLAKPAPIKTMDAVWVSGTLSSARSDSPMGVSGYQMAGDLVEPYRETRTEK